MSTSTGSTSAMKRSPTPNRYRDSWAGELDAARAGTQARVSGWVHRRRDHGGLIFIDLRERSGIVQLVFHPETAPDAHAKAHSLRAEDVITASGTVNRRAPENVNPNLATGEIELAVDALELLADAQTPPFPVDEDTNVDENLRLRHRSLDLRRAPMQEAIAVRHRAVQTIREVLDERDFLEIETPFLTRSTPEGARDFLVPARVAPGSFYALPQSPQLFKQLLMIGGFERYYQIVRCFRDEDSRADRMTEFTQLDMELSFVAEDDVYEVTEAVMATVFERAGFRRRFAAVAADDPRRGDGAVRIRPSRHALRARARGSRDGARANRVQGVRRRTARRRRRQGDQRRRARAAALGARRARPSSPSSMAPRASCGRSCSTRSQAGARRSPSSCRRPRSPGSTRKLNAATGDLLLIVADQPSTTAQVLGALRLDLARRFELVPSGSHEILWVVQFPMFAWRPEEQRWDAEHHPFTAPATAAGVPATAADLDDPSTLLSRSYDLVLDGIELGGGSIRNHRTDVQERIFELLGIDEQEAQARFGFLLDALRYGAPPHGGIAFGLDRLVALLVGRENIRETIAFPKATSGADPLTGAPAPVDAVQLRELGLRLA